MNLARGDEVPQIITLRTRLRPSEFLTSPAKRLLQHYLTTAGSFTAAMRQQTEASVQIGAGKT
jgi:hypothetical protein